MVKIATFHVMFYTFTNNNIQCFFITGAEVKMMIDVDTFYLNETTTIQCSASEDTELLELRTSKDGVEKGTGCFNAAGWGGRDNIFLEGLITDSDCTTALQSPPFIITLQPTVTEQLEGLNFWCVAYDSATSTLKNTSSVTVNNIKGKLIVNYLL